MKTALTIIASIFTLIVAVDAAVVIAVHISCRDYGEAFNLKTKSISLSCYVITPKGPIERDRYQLDLIYNGTPK